MITLRPRDERGRMRLDWLDSRHTFSFDRYYDPKHMGFRDLRVINEDWIAAGAGFPTHGHRDMEILTIVLEGGLVHRDSTGVHDTIVSGEVQRMTAGTGIRHSELNSSATEPLHLLQIWILPEREGLEPGYEKRTFDRGGDRDRWQLVAAPNGRGGALTIRQDVELFIGSLPAGGKLHYDLRPGRHAWLQVASGSLALEGRVLEAGDGAALSGESALDLEAATAAEVLLFDLR